METDSNRIERHVWIISMVVILGTMMSILDTTIVNVALDTLAHEFHTTISQIQWVVTGYMLALAAVIPVTGWAARRVGAKRIYLVSLVLFTLGSALCGLAQTSTELIFFRVLQGLGGGMLMPIGQLMMAQAAGPKRMGRVMSLVAIPMMLAPILGPTIGGLIIQNLSWRWIFVVNVPVGAIAVIAAWRVLPRSDGQAAEPLDVVGFVYMVLGLPLITYGLAEVGELGTFNSPRVILPSIAGILFVALFVLHALRVKHPLLDLRLHRKPTFSSAAFTMFCLGAALFGAMILMPLYWQEIRHYSVVATGLLTGPQGIGMALAMPFAGRFAERYGGGPVALFGVVLTTLASIPFALITAHTPVIDLVVAMIVRGAGIGFAFMPAMTAAFAALEHDELSHATPQLNVLQRVGGSIGVAVLAVVLQRALVGAHTVDAQAAAFGTAFWWSAALTALAIIPCVILMRAERAARIARATKTRVDANALAEAVA